MAIGRILKPENSIIMGGAVIGLVVAAYQGGIGSMSTAHATNVSDPNLSSAKRKAGMTAVAMVAGIGLLARDPNIVILGGATIIAMELGFTHAIHSNPATGALQSPPVTAYQPAQNVVPLVSQGQAVSGYTG